MSARFADYGGVDPGVWNCELLDDAENIVASGSGKGERSAATVGALFEALEHFFIGTAGIRPEELTLRSSHDRARHILSDDVVCGPLLDAPDVPLACRRYLHLADHSEADLPLFVACQDYLESAPMAAHVGDTYDYSWVSRYAFSSGYGAGTNYAEAVIHGLNEGIERDAFSLLLARTFLREHPAPLHVLDPATLPDDLATLLTTARDRTLRDVQLVELTTDLGVPAILAYLPPRGEEAARVRGCGASLSRWHAVRRALTELLQLEAATRNVAAFTEEGDQLTQYPRLFACYRMNLDQPLHSATRIPYRDTAAPPTPDEHLRQLSEVLAARSLPAYACELFTATNGVTVASTVVPGLERFLVVTDGRPVVPGPRGMAARTNRPQ